MYGAKYTLTYRARRRDHVSYRWWMSVVFWLFQRYINKNNIIMMCNDVGMILLVAGFRVWARRAHPGTRRLADGRLSSERLNCTPCTLLSCCQSRANESSFPPSTTIHDYRITHIQTYTHAHTHIPRKQFPKLYVQGTNYFAPDEICSLTLLLITRRSGN